jgi:sRNA-binding protein
MRRKLKTIIITPAPRTKAPVKKPAAVERHHKNMAATNWLRATWPHIFGAHPAPAMIGVRRMIMPAAIAAGFTTEAIARALRFLTSQEAYLRAVAAPNSYRLDLNGQTVGPVLEEHRAEARAKLKAMRDAGTQAPTAIPLDDLLHGEE